MATILRGDSVTRRKEPFVIKHSYGFRFKCVHKGAQEANKTISSQTTLLLSLVKSIIAVQYGLMVYLFSVSGLLIGLMKEEVGKG